jgi:hemoglobin
MDLSSPAGTAPIAEIAPMGLSYPLTPEALTPVAHGRSGEPDAGATENASWTTRDARPAPAPALASSLYERLGRREGIARIVRSLIENHLVNPLVKTRFENTDIARLEQHAIDFVCAGVGGPETYSGRDMLSAHRGMNISEQEFVAVVDDAMAALSSSGIEPATQNEVLGILWSLKGQVVRVWGGRCGRAMEGQPSPAHGSVNYCSLHHRSSHAGLRRGREFRARCGLDAKAREQV